MIMERDVISIDPSKSTLYNRPVRPNTSYQDLSIRRTPSVALLLPICDPSETPDQVLVHHKRRTRPRQDPQRVRTQTLVKRSETFLSERPGDGLWDVWVDVRSGGVLSRRMVGMGIRSSSTL